VVIVQSSGSKPVLGGDTHFEKETLATHQECPNYCFVSTIGKLHGAKA
jgi:hypothetical protein